MNYTLKSLWLLESHNQTLHRTSRCSAASASKEMNSYILKQSEESSIEIIHELNCAHSFATLFPHEIKVKAAIEISLSVANSKES